MDGLTYGAILERMKRAEVQTPLTLAVSARREHLSPGARPGRLYLHGFGHHRVFTPFFHQRGCPGHPGGRHWAGKQSLENV